jgi:hypothetical protein
MTYPSIEYAANIYLNLEDESDKVTTDTIVNMVRFIHELYAQIPVDVVFTSEDPYGDIEDLRVDIRNTRSFKVWSGCSQHPLWGTLTNCKLRAAHDYFDHYIGKQETDLSGEYASYRRMCERWVNWCSTLDVDSETVLQGVFVLRSEMWYQPATASYLSGYCTMPPQKLVLMTSID